MPTYACNASCKDCGTLSNPFQKEKISFETICKAIDQAKQLKFENIVFTGGEATLRWKDLLKSIDYATKLNFPTRLVTNAHWARSEKITELKVVELISAGLKEINFSTGDEHVRFVPIDNVALATAKALQNKLTSAIMIEVRQNNLINQETFLTHPHLKDFQSELGKTFTIHESPWMPLSPYQTENYPDGLLTNIDNLASRIGCESVLQTYVLQPNGNIGSCCGLAMRIIPELNNGKILEDEAFLEAAIKKSEKDFLKIWLHYKGPEKIIAWASKKNPNISWENMYAHKCQACHRLYKDPMIRQVIKENYLEMFSEVILSAFMEEKFITEKFSEYIESKK